MNQLEQTRLHVLNSVLEHQLPVAQAAEILGVSERHACRLLPMLNAWQISASSTTRGLAQWDVAGQAALGGAGITGTSV